MRWRRRVSIIFGIITAAALAAPAVHACRCNEITARPQEADSVDRTAGLAFSRSAQYRRQVDSAVRQARSAVRSYLHEPNIAVVADIDETLLDNRPAFQRKPDFKWSDFSAWMEEARAPLIKPVAEFLSWARKNGCAVFLITGRQEKTRAATVRNLVARGVSYDGLYMRPNGNREPAEKIKTPHRQAIEEMGFKIVVNIGDQWSDLTGGHAIDCQKLPNKMYFVP